MKRTATSLAVLAALFYSNVSARNADFNGHTSISDFNDLVVLGSHI
jgi:hypothetical protein